MQSVMSGGGTPLKLVLEGGVCKTTKYKLETKFTSFIKLNTKTSITILPTIRRECMEIGDDGDVVLTDKTYPVCSTAVKEVNTTVQLVDENGWVVEKGLKCPEFTGVKDRPETTLTFKSFPKGPLQGMTFRLNKKSDGDYHTGHEGDCFRLRVTVNVSSCSAGLMTYVQDSLPKFNLPFYVVARNITPYAREKKQERDRLRAKTRIRKSKGPK